MQVIYIAMAFLAVLDVGVLVWVPRFDRWLYRNYPEDAPAVKPYFSNGKDEVQVYRLIYRSVGMVLVSAITLGIVLLTLYGHYTNG